MELDEISRFIIDSIGDWNHTYVLAQKEMEMEGVYCGKFPGIYRGKLGNPENIFGDKLYEFLNSSQKIVTFSNIKSWIAFNREIDFCLSSRFHGGVAAMMADVPTVVIPIDSRMRELVCYHKLPFINRENIGSETIENIFNTLDYASYKNTFIRNQDHLKSFMDLNGIPNTLGFQGVTPYEKKSAEVEWNSPVVNWNSIPTSEKAKRMFEDFFGKVYNKLHRHCVYERR